MKEVTFIRQHLEKWRGYETVAESSRLSTPDEMAEAYIDVTSDLAFAQTHYPHSRITLYLNNLASALHNENMTNLFGGLISGFSGVDIFVFEDELERAREIMEAAHESPHTSTAELPS